VSHRTKDQFSSSLQTLQFMERAASSRFELCKSYNIMELTLSLISERSWWSGEVPGHR